MINFDRIAPIYKILEKITFGTILIQARRTYLEHLPLGKMLLLGDGNGDLHQALQHTRRHFSYVEPSQKMLLLAQNRAFTQSNTVWHLKTWQEFFLDNQNTFDCICLPFVLDLFTSTEQKELLNHCYKSLTPNGILWVADFQNPQNWRKCYTKPLLLAMILFFKITTKLPIWKLHSWQHEIENLSFQQIKKKKLMGEFLHIGLWSK